MKTLSAEESEALAKLLSPALDPFQLEHYVYLGTGDRLFDEFVGRGNPKNQTIRELIAALERGPITDKFLRVVYREKPYQAELRRYIASLYPDIPANAGRKPIEVDFQVAGVPDGAPSAGPALQRIVKKKLPAVDTEIWLSTFENIKRQVCRIEADGAGIGTGFLVGPEAVLTNWHVVREARSRGVLERLACRFDYRRLVGGGTDAGVSIAVAAVLDESACSPAELTAQVDVPPPLSDQLDYALLRIATAVPDRGFQRLADPPPSAQGDPLVIVQHPEGDPQRFAMDTDAVIGLCHDGLRLRYSTNTAPGSSGSPCFNFAWDLLALHHLGDPRLGNPVYNQGVPVGLIRSRIAAQGLAHVLAA